MSKKHHKVKPMKKQNKRHVESIKESTMEYPMKTGNFNFCLIELNYSRIEISYVFKPKTFEGREREI